MKGNFKANKGITLVALIVTIIVLLILAVVTIKLMVDNGVIGRAKGATSKYKVAEEKELIQLAYSNYKMGIIDGGPFANDKELLERYFLGEDKEGREYYSFLDRNEYKFIGNDVITDASTSLTIVGEEGDEVGNDILIIKYNNNIWKVIIQNRGSMIGKITIGVEYVLTISDVNKNDSEQELLERYFLGDDKNGLDFMSLIVSTNLDSFDDIKFENNKVIGDANTTISVVGARTGEDYSYQYMIKYKDNIYILSIMPTQQGDNFVMLTTKVEFATSMGGAGDLQLAIKGATVVGDENSGWTITFNKTGNVYTLAPEGKTFEGVDKTENIALVKKYFLGANGAGRLITDVCYYQANEAGNELNFAYGHGFKNDANSIKDASMKISLILYNNNYDADGNFESSNNYIRYNDVIYRVDINKEGRITAAEMEYMPTGREGQKITYSYDGTKANEREWLILYDYGDSIEIISPDSIGNLTLGKDDEEAQTPGDIDKDGTANTDIDKAIYSYNNALTRINAYTSSLVTNSNKISVRSVGSNPENPSAESETNYTSSNLTKWCNGRYNGIGKKGDNNYKEDYIRMSYFKVKNIRGEYYWIASREAMEEKSWRACFSIRYVRDNFLDKYFLWTVESSSPSALTTSKGVRPVVKISSKDIK